MLMDGASDGGDLRGMKPPHMYSVNGKYVTIVRLFGNHAEW